MTSAGSLENLTRLADPQSPVNVGLTQADALKYYLKDHPGFADQFISLGEIGKECVFIVTGKDSEIRSDSDLQQKRKGRLIAVQSPNSGVAVTWEYMTVLEPAFKNTAPAFVDGAEALLQIKSSGKASKIQAAMVVQKPMAKSTEMQVVLENPKDFRLVPVKDWDLNDKLPDGSAVYTFENVTVAEKKWGFDTAVDTICTRGLMLANKTKLTARPTHPAVQGHAVGRQSGGRGDGQVDEQRFGVKRRAPSSNVLRCAPAAPPAPRDAVPPPPVRADRRS